MYSLGDRAFSVAAPRAWNNLPPHIRIYLPHGRLLNELEIFSVFTNILTVVFLSVFLFLFLFSCSAPLLYFGFIYGALIWT